MELLLNRRENPRISLMQSIEFAVTTSFEHAVLKTLGTGGLCFVTSAPPQVGRQLLLRFEIPGHDQVIHAIGVIVWSRPVNAQHAEVGIRFIGLREDSLDRLRQLCQAGAA
ncbi:MAG: hypothetical protein A2Y95_09560 [Deltaproteobacteria bacterium RBG_13_65_10]|nr:MAG: hypothetical protein A2Y95_09560 [Deltaproteobacteria bacterium RBG_13_65_10]